MSLDEQQQLAAVGWFAWLPFDCVKPLVDRPQQHAMHSSSCVCGQSQPFGLGLFLHEQKQQATGRDSCDLVFRYDADVSCSMYMHTSSAPSTIMVPFSASN